LTSWSTVSHERPHHLGNLPAGDFGLRSDYRTLRALGLVLLIATAVACEDASPAPAPTPTPSPTVTDDFTGTLGKNGAVEHSFTLVGTGSVTAQLKSLDPDATQVLGMYIGTWDGASCTVFKANENVTVGSTMLVTANSVGSLCVRIYDSGKITDPAATFNYDIQVIHP
jgi:hypothetical protein